MAMTDSYSIPLILLITTLILFAIPVSAAINTIPAGGTVFIGEQGLDVTATGISDGSQIAYYGPGGGTSDVPASVVTVDDAKDLYISSVTFESKTGPWYLLPSNSLAFYVDDPTLELRVLDISSGFEVTPEVTWVPTGDAVGFRIDTNLVVMKNRSGVSGAPVTIKVFGPNSIEFSTLNGYSLVDIPVASSPFETGPVWNTGDSAYPSGGYTVYAECNANDMKDNYRVVGKTVSSPVNLVIQKVNPLITTEATTPVTAPTAVPTTEFPVTTEITPSHSPTTEQTPLPTLTTMPTTALPTTTPTTAPGFGALSVIACGIPGLVLLYLKKK